MRILFLTNFYPPYEAGGLEQNCQEVVVGLGARGHVCQVLTSRYGMQGSPLLEAGVARVLHLEADQYHYRPLDFFLRRPRQERANQRALRAALDTFQPDIVFIWGMWNLSRNVAYWAERLLRGRVAYAVASYWLAEPDRHEAYWGRPSESTWVRTLLGPACHLALGALREERKAHPLALEHVACVSEYVRCKLSEAGVLPHGARVIYNGIDAQPFVEARATSTQRHDGLSLIYTGGIVAHKGVHTAVEALGWLRQRGEAGGVHLTIVGGGHPDYEQLLKQRVGELGLEEQVTFCGRVPREQIPGLLSGSDVFLFTSVWEEPIARSVMEAMAAGLAVIGTAVGGQREMLQDGVNALVFPPEDPEGLAGCILRLRSDPVSRAQLAAAGQRMVLQRFTLQRAIDEMEAWLEQIVT